MKTYLTPGQAISGCHSNPTNLTVLELTNKDCHNYDKYNAVITFCIQRTPVRRQTKSYIQYVCKYERHIQTLTQTTNHHHATQNTNTPIFWRFD